MSKTKKSNKKIVLVLHGFPGLSERDALRKYLKNEKFEVVLPNLFDQSFKFTIENVVDWIDKELKGRKPDAILAFSMGGLIAPHVALKYPGAELLMVATGPRIEFGIKPLNFLLKNLNDNLIHLVLNMAVKVPFGLYKFCAITFNRYKGTESGKYKYYNQDIPDSYKMFTSHKPGKLYEITKFARIVDNAEILKTLKNKTLILGGENDYLMPRKLSLELKKLIKNSELVENPERIHFEVFDERDFDRVDKFLNI